LRDGYLAGYSVMNPIAAVAAADDMMVRLPLIKVMIRCSGRLEFARSLLPILMRMILFSRIVSGSALLVCVSGSGSMSSMIWYGN
jgi:hypothetical protein